jgi:hypothetical protein
MHQHGVALVIMCVSARHRDPELSARPATSAASLAVFALALHPIEIGVGNLFVGQPRRVTQAFISLQSTIASRSFPRPLGAAERMISGVPQGLRIIFFYESHAAGRRRGAGTSRCQPPLLLSRRIMLTFISSSR